MTARWMEIVTRLGDTVLDVAHVPAGTVYRLGAVALAATPQQARFGLVDVTVTPSARPVCDLPRAAADPGWLAYAVGSLVAHVAMWGLAIEIRPHAGAPPASLGDRNAGGAVAFLIAGGGAGAPRDTEDDDGAAERPAISMALADPRRAPATAIETAGMPDLAGALRDLVATTDVASGFSPGQTGGAGAGVGDGTGDGFGQGIGGGPPAHGLLGTAAYATGLGGFGMGGGRGGLASRDSRVPTLSFCGGPLPCVVTGDLDKAIVRRYIQRQRERVEYCYTKQLLATPGLAGTVTVGLVIDPDGTVGTASASGMHDEVAGCVENVVRAIAFPRSRTGTATQVRYPFTFRPVD